LPWRLTMNSFFTVQSLSGSVRIYVLIMRFFVLSVKRVSGFLHAERLYHAYVNSKQRRTLARVFETPTRADLLWSDIESLFRALGAITVGIGGSRVGVKLSTIR